MADPKKDAKKPDTKGGEGFVFEIEMVILAFLILTELGSYLYYILKGFTGDNVTVNGQKIPFFSYQWEIFKSWFSHFAIQTINTVTFISIFVTLILIMAAYFAKFRKSEIVEELKHKDSQLMQAGLKSGHIGQVFSASNGGNINLPGANTGLATVESAGTVQWKNIEKYMQSYNPSDWRLAILEADILLYDMLEQIGFQGDTIADKLKSIDPASFNTLDDAWRAHKVRNNIAHEGSNYELTHDEARKTIAEFKRVFDEFYFV